jgi:hypothetical protein
MTIPFRTADRRIRFNAKETHWPASAVVTVTLQAFEEKEPMSPGQKKTEERWDLFLCMLLMTVLW